MEKSLTNLESFLFVYKLFIICVFLYKNNIRLVTEIAIGP
jgi:hypothetical protein